MACPDSAQGVEVSTMTKPIPKFGSKSQIRVAWASETVRHCETVNREMASNDVQWRVCIKHLTYQ